MPDLLIAPLLLLAVAVGWLGVLRVARGVRHTSLIAAAAWAIWFQVTLTVTTIATLSKDRVPLGILDQLWYLTAVSALCPFVAVLGARRGRLLDWSLFIVLPLIVVLEWSALAQLTRCWNGQRLELETPALIGYGLVMLMCLGTYVFSFGRFSMAILQRMFWRTAADVIRTAPAQYGWNRVWFDFRDWFGAAWATRLSTRINEVAEREQWPWRLTHAGWQPARLVSGIRHGGLAADHTPEIVDPDSPVASAIPLKVSAIESAPMGPPADDPRVDHTLRWLLKPFVDPEWIDERLSQSGVS